MIKVHEVTIQPKHTKVNQRCVEQTGGLRGLSPPTAGSHYKPRRREATQRERSGMSAVSHCAASSPETCHLLT